ncbi:MAG: hypothetical protein FJ148_28385, partial [Deltaproteobacteria bacterium]|nr:hypothetical protein [Deltaproteobacteria bacterium]
MRILVVLFAFAAVVIGAGATARAQDAAVTMTPDRLHLLVNKRLGSERWSIAVNLSPADPTKIVSVTGNVFRDDDDDVSFLHCAERPGATGSLADPSSTLRFTCRGTNGCDGTALACARADWSVLARDIATPAAFFLPEGGLDARGEAAV